MNRLYITRKVDGLDESLDYYTKVLRMQVLNKRDYPEGRFTLAFLGYPTEADSTILELSYNWN
ncbi:MAG: hypothetical protein KAR32_14770 [Candidatus Omnitrophica bacterium]|nr:hypothetical protein [Candidatus Omnitrophota bacterium]